MTGTLTIPEITATDRCGAGARVRVMLPSGGELLFCGHHSHEHEARLRDLDATITEGAPLA